MNRNLILVALIAIGIFSCSKKEGAMTVQGNIIGLQKGTLYLQKLQDTLLVSVDSVFLNGESSFVLVDDLKDPEMYYLKLDKNGDNKIEFFGEKGIITINSKLEKFTIAAKISGSTSNDILMEYRDMANQFSGKRLDLLKATFEAQASEDAEEIEKLDKDLQRLIKNRYRYTTSFALRNSKSEVAPYLALTELFDAHITLLDTVNNSLSKKVKASKYGIALNEFIKEIKETEAN
ncbi:MAG: DUF4369 domain-containing protein [Flavobacteriaceae bacterium]